MGAGLNNPWRDGVSDLRKHRERVGRRNLQATAVLEVGQGRIDRSEFVGLLRVLAKYPSNRPTATNAGCLVISIRAWFASGCAAK